MKLICLTYRICDDICKTIINCRKACRVWITQPGDLNRSRLLANIAIDFSLCVLTDQLKYRLVTPNKISNI